MSARHYMLLAASQSKTEAENGATDDILPRNEENGLGNRRRKATGASQPLFIPFRNWLEYPVLNHIDPESFTMFEVNPGIKQA